MIRAEDASPDEAEAGSLRVYLNRQYLSKQPLRASHIPL
jgi:hypothetical protein